MEQKDLEYYLSQVRRIADHREKGAMQEIRKAYKSLMQELQHFVADEYAQYAKDDQLTFAMLNQKRQYARFIEDATAVVDKWYPAMAKKATAVVDEIYKLTYDGMVSAVKKSNTTEALKEALKGVKAATPQVVKRAIANPIGGITLPDTLERNRQNIIYEIKQQLNIGLVNGDRYSTMAKRISDRVDIDYRKAVRIVRTETHRVREAGFNDSATEINDTLKQGVTAQRLVKTWQTMEDERVRDTNRADHRKMNGVSVGVDEEFNLGNGVKTKVPGQSGSAANDCNCRCFVVYELKEDEEVAKKLKAEAEKKAAAAQQKEAPLSPEEIDMKTPVARLDKEKFKDWFSQEHGGSRRFDEAWAESIDGTVEDLLKDLTSGMTEYGQRNKLKKISEYFDQNAAKQAISKAIPREKDYIDGVSEIALNDPRKKEEIRRQYIRVANEYRLDSLDEAREIMDQGLAKIVEESDFGIRITAENLQKVLDSGSFKNQFETGSSGGAFNPDMRKRVELELFNVPKANGKGMSDADRPVYGMLMPKYDGSDDVKYFYMEGAGSWYGDGVVCILKRENVINQATITLGDSLDYRSKLGATEARKPTFTGTSNSGTRLADVAKGKVSVTDAHLELDGDHYFEYQLHGKQSHSIENIEKVYIDKFRAERDGGALIAKLEEKGIPYEIIEGGSGW